MLKARWRRLALAVDVIRRRRVPVGEPLKPLPQIGQGAGRRALGPGVARRRFGFWPYIWFWRRNRRMGRLLPVLDVAVAVVTGDNKSRVGAAVGRIELVKPTRLAPPLWLP
jgi:hypothetical protein